MTVSQLECLFVLERFVSNDTAFDTFVDLFWSDFSSKGGLV